MSGYTWMKELWKGQKSHSEKFREHIQHIILLQRKIWMDWTCTQTLVRKPG